ncbi:2-succinyl-5-enolpyruvyl-6-hydroxy-3-cyclohexene-1-carboxylic-acid synthase [Glaesserella parasuis]|uniref:2-succinyl-5-enolpyruvyl-6-hydroxy-3- cyclohexene-1-carboxylic-acid synthase n=1 Tax=Glaesserella parasuis TaxID=738 RepID=UPI0009E65D98|nr:2-succinyl-5-enolpyruvyl-6-hydroxy-3-cyclohexene-1-carboxylic-acid synthase [Glaesserella parasuis]MDO9647523.1 2-succinyl-5-enolpyruvyl-6-hydroxy-3-cyclohexene-1-carboxylic-acid synthase [Glaesserella parasuis]MDO9743824.1 2-succinyl-5-enolpyruvyl-6-hydroxy-3-cyclohexene-1-carboxylic-acid synthase [Glaesserella parasuis]MDO9756816.1 2-succinyl-5-enolpyruvyl-6-hydroxy-3-cyclohexene-1-carboxylic-acid synthase [Glaesserella parasuis]MDO9785677.1 2-succinyl-5-enolpyruvyl-6-hydroxy-3-cyclohexene
MTNISTFNRSWSRVILNALLRYGVKHICIAPGSRSTPLTLEALYLQKQGQAECHSHFDERGLGFFALGLAKATQDPVAIIVTSGTAVANLYPAVIEASITHHKLIVLSADRPLELIGCGANQAIEQQHIFSHYPIASLNLPKPNSQYSASWLVGRVEQACSKQVQQGGVIHINAPFAEPLYEADEESIGQDPWLLAIQGWLNKPQVKWYDQQATQQDVLMHENWDYWRTKRGVIVVGKLPLEQGMGLKLWAETLGWCLISDVQSGVDASLPYADIWLSNKTVEQRLLQADIVIQFGSQIVSKRVNQFLSAFKGEFWLVEETTDYLNTYAHQQTRFVAKAHHFTRVHPPLRQKPWLLEPLALSQFCETFIEQQVGGNLNEASLAHHIERVLPANGNLFIGNSLFVRLVDALCKLPEGYPIYTNRGASGIDGLIATLAGIAKGSGQPTVAVIGDISALHDLNSVSLLRQISQPTILFVINNNGGAIFDMLPVDQKAKDKFYRLSHNLEFSQIATMFGLEYLRPYTWADLATKLKQAYARRGVTIVEIKVNDQEGSSLYKSLIEQISRASID